ncbi:hypothetical protein [Aeromonas schubertii]|uniref:hypothetical protein n=1 Tax=Aeromonas schubertii TaxID=652 RepID=UPI001CC53094|nr:hypothetical protein [Aeromonas schubertii]MBZ6072034.1 hypothetical protein [Aeromonas schubertii]
MLDELHRLASQLRTALNQIAWSQMPDGFKDFPAGTCNSISNVLAEHLYTCGVTGVELVIGSNMQLGSHAWLEISGIIVDITADQFPDISASVLVTTDHQWHSQFEENEGDRPIAGFSDDDHDLREIYHAALAFIGNDK